MKSSASGFTLIELVIVIVILGILAATVAPKFAGVETAARQAVADGAGAALLSTGAIQLAVSSGTAVGFASLVSETDGVGIGTSCATGDAAYVASATCSGVSGGSLLVTVTECAGAQSTDITVSNSLCSGA